MNCTKFRFDLILFDLIDPRVQRRGRGQMRSGPTTGSGGTADDGLADEGGVPQDISDAVSDVIDARVHK